MKPTHTIPSLSGTFVIHTGLALNPKMPKEPSIPSRSIAQKINIAAKIRNDNDETKNGQLVTKCKRHYPDTQADAHGVCTRTLPLIYDTLHMIRYHKKFIINCLICIDNLIFFTKEYYLCI